MMDKITELYNRIGLYLPEMLLPSGHIDLQKWSVVACDQFTSQPEYWKAVDRFVGDSPSTLRMILPEVYMQADKDAGHTDQAAEIDKINLNMTKYISDGTLRSIGNCAIYTERTLTSGKKRKGIVLAVDLEKYDYSPHSTAMIRPSEGTVTERLPPRVAIRRRAALESPHILLLFDDRSQEALSVFENISHSMKLAYDFDLMMGGGHITGYRIDPDAQYVELIRFAEILARCGANNNSNMVFAVGDGNHSLAAAKTYWEELKASGAHNLPAQYALVEIVNIYDDAMEFEPIHRIIFGINTEELIALLVGSIPALCSMKVIYQNTGESQNTAGYIETNDKNKQIIPFISTDTNGIIEITGSPYKNAAGTFQYCLEKITQSAKAAAMKVDYIHGRKALEELVFSSQNSGNAVISNTTTGFYMPEIGRDDFFATIVKEGKYPLKAFSIGHANEKRYYLESRKIR